jgi:hypothetical protein
MRHREAAICQRTKLSELFESMDASSIIYYADGVHPTLPKESISNKIGAINSHRSEAYIEYISFIYSELTTEFHRVKNHGVHSVTL